MEVICTVFSKVSQVSIFIPIRTFLVRFGGISGEFGLAMFRIMYENRAELKYI